MIQFHSYLLLSRSISIFRKSGGPLVAHHRYQSFKQVSSWLNP